ncbi:bacteriohemerythrin [Magnetospirillum sp. SS-4]|uniref:bacteriohemerythrin n=1 Tax=Magnetospirillum sp. SS-4 TaxID=2681465 RepID=UPI001385A025|nr:bacteriohemerythrin [Magnetospirillum sp. SS-4]CAA7627388.1 putative Bacteriohemerythrin [Magnetospirillum sp. SS-4]
MDRDQCLTAGQNGMDKEHKIQIGLLVALEQALATGKSHPELLVILEQLVDYTNIHFMSEQMLMRLYAYPDIAAHEAAHDRLIDQARRVMEDFASGELTMVSAGLLTLKQWLIDHIRTDDHAFHRHLSSHAPAA